MAASETIDVERLSLVTFSEEFLSERYVGWLNDSDVVRYSEQRLHMHTMQSCKQYLLSLRESPSYFWAIVVKNREPAHIGNITAYLDSANGVADLGILIGDRSVWTRGYGTEAWRAACGYLFGHVGIRKITAGAISSNRPMLRLMEKCNMREDGIRVDQQIFEGDAVDVIHRALFREDWLEAQAE